MNTTTSVYDILVQMTTLNEGHCARQESFARSAITTPCHKELSPPSAPATSTVRPSTPSKSPETSSLPRFHYHSRSGGRRLTLIEIAQEICLDPRGQHLVWRSGWSSWRPWHKISVVREAVDLIYNGDTSSKGPERDSAHSARKRDALRDQRPPQRQRKRSKHTMMNWPLRQPLEGPVQSAHSSFQSDPLVLQSTLLAIDFTHCHDSGFYSGVSESLDEVGLFIATEQLLEVGSLVEVSVTWAKGESPMMMRGVIDWTRDPNVVGQHLPCGVGVKFLNLTAGAQRKIDELMRLREPIFYAA